MLGTQGGEVRIFGGRPERRQEAKSFVEQRLPDVVKQVPNGSPGRVVLSEDLASAVANVGLVVESVPEKLELKRKVFGDLDRLTPPDAILASNSSSYASSQLLEFVTRPERVLNMHFLMPPELPVVEIMSCGKTDPAIIQKVMETAPRFGLEPYLVHNESVGFIFNRIWAAIKRESQAVVAENVSTPAEVDAIYKRVLNVRSGPFRLMDRVGLDVVLDIEEHYAAERTGIPEGPRKLLREYITRGWLGEKTGRGFYEYSQKPPQS